MLLSALVLSSVVYAQDPRVLNGLELVDSVGTVVGVGPRWNSPDLIHVPFEFISGSITMITFYATGPSFNHLWFATADCSGTSYVVSTTWDMIHYAAVVGPTWDIYAPDTSMPIITSQAVESYRDALGNCRTQSSTRSVRPALYVGRLGDFFTPPFSVRRAP